jgi:hypothetical protein
MAKIPQKKPYIIKVEGMAPVILEYRVMAENEDRAYQVFDKQPYLLQLFNPPQVDKARVRKIRVSIRSQFTNIINWVKSF